MKQGVFDYKRRPTTVTHVGGVEIGGDNPIRLQSMNNTSTADVEASVAQALRIADAGADIDRFTTQGVREAVAAGEIREQLRKAGCNMPIVADIHFNPKAAFAAAERVDKVRINPGNFVDPGRTFKQIDYTDEQYAAELKKIEDVFGPFLDLCREHGTAVRIGVNHGSLSDRIMSRYGNTPAGMVESAMEFLRVARSRGFNDVVISIKASNTVVMVQTVRLLVEAMNAENMAFPLHLGVTEAGDGEDGRIRSAVGIGTLLAHGIGDTIRVSLSEEPECEIPVARELADYITKRSEAPIIGGTPVDGYNPLKPESRLSDEIGIVGGNNLPVVVGLDTIEAPMLRLDASLPHSEMIKIISANADKVIVLASSHLNPVGEITAAIHTMMRHGLKNPVVASLSYNSVEADKVVIRASADFGTLLLDGLIDGIELLSDTMDQVKRNDLALGILQAARRRVSKTEFVSCPGCGRTLFNLQHTVGEVKKAVSHLKGLKIAVMGCIVNGPGEMADADYGYVGAGVGNVSLYRGKEVVRKNIPSSQAVEELIALIKADGRWVEPTE